MKTYTKARKAMAVALGLLVLVVPFLGQFAPEAQARAAAADPAMEQVWSRTDLAVEAGRVARTWMWGPEPFYNTYEPYVEGPGGQHLVSYYDKSRMEINNPSGDRNSQWFVTNGLLVVEMMSGRIQRGNNSFEQRQAADVVVAGDADSPNAPTYRTLAGVSSVGAERRAPDRTGQQIREGLGRGGNVGSADSLAPYAKYGTYEPTLGHNIADVFWSFLNQQGTIYQNGNYQNGQLVDWLFAMGYPISEPYWINIKAGGQERWVLMQAFQRRVLTYSPFNPEGWKVEMANVGRAYYNWRYGNNNPAPPTATTTTPPLPVPAPALGIDPADGDTNTVVTLRGRNFPAHAAVTISVENAGAGYNKGIGTVAAGGDGKFEAKINIPADASKLDRVDIVAAANGGAIKVAQTFRLRFEPSINVASGREVLSGGALRVTGSGFPANRDINIGLIFDGNVDWRGRTRANGHGEFDTTIDIGTRLNGARFQVVAVADGGVKATYRDTFTVIGNATLQVVPGSGQAGVWVSVRGANWPAHRTIDVGLRFANSRQENWTGRPAVSDAAGNFAVDVFVGPEYANNEVRVFAVERLSGLRIEATYRATGQPPAPTISLSPNTLAVGQTATVTGANWPANRQLSIGVGRTNVEEWVSHPTTDGAGRFSISFVLSPRWANAGQITVAAVVGNGPTATTPLWVIGSGGGTRIQPSGLPMSVTTVQSGNSIAIKLKASGWQPGRQVTISVISADRAVNTPVASARVKDDGTFQVAFEAAAPWWSRTDLGVIAVSDNGQQSVRYLPATQAAKTGGNTLTVSASNWPGNAAFEIYLRDKANGDTQLYRGTSDANGNFNVEFAAPRIPNGGKPALVITAPGEQYSAEFDL